MISARCPLGVPEMETIEEFRELLSTLDDDFALYCSAHAPPSEEEIAALETRLGITLPEGYKAFLASFGGVYLEVKEHAWPRPKLFQIGPSWTFLYGLMVLGIGSDTPDFLDIERVGASFAEENGEWLPFRLVPVFRWVGSADFVCLDQDGALYEWFHDSPSEPEQLDETFLQMVAREVSSLAENKARILDELAKNT
jgi:hypothetical protein